MPSHHDVIPVSREVLASVQRSFRKALKAVRKISRRKPSLRIRRLGGQP